MEPESRAPASAPLPALRPGLDFMPSPITDRPGLLVRDPLQYGDQVLIFPPPLVPLLAFFDGEHDEGDLRAALVQATGDLEVEPLLRHLVAALQGGVFLEGPGFERARAERHAAFAAAPMRVAAHAGSAYPDEADRLRDVLREYLGTASASGSHDGSRQTGPYAIAAPHVSPDGGWRSYAAAYRALGPGDGVRTAVILGTSHYGAPGRFGLTRKPYLTPLGAARPALDLVDELAGRAGQAVVMEDYCHSIEHSIEFQVVFLQATLGPDVRIVPILCGAFDDRGPEPAEDEDVGRFIEALAAIAAREGDGLLFVLGIDMAHVGRRYGDAARARAEEGPLLEVAARDHARIERALAGDAAGFWALVRGEDGDDLKWCGSSPLYTFLRAAGPVRGQMLRYEQWNIDESSVVTFGGLVFERAAGSGLE